MSINPSAYGAVGMYPIHAESICISCKDKLSKKHGLNQNRSGPPTTMGWFIGGTGPRCVWCHKNAWCDREFWQRTGTRDHLSGQYHLRDIR